MPVFSLPLRYGIGCFSREAYEFIDLRSVAKLCVIPIQDYLGLDDRARINKPSTVGMNWRWRIRPDQLNDGLCRRMRMQADTYGRI